MPYTDLLRVTVLLTGAEATALAGITAIGANRDNDATTILVAGVWWLVALAIGFYLGRPSRAADGVRDVLTEARMATSLPSETPARIAIGRLWPIALTALAAGILGTIYPGVAGDRGRLRPARLPRLAYPRGRGPRDRATRRSQVLRRPQLRPPSDQAGAHARASLGPPPRLRAPYRFISREKSRQPRVLATCSAASQARRAVATA